MKTLNVSKKLPALNISEKIIVAVIHQRCEFAVLDKPMNAKKQITTPMY
jgi:hypothetical protein